MIWHGVVDSSAQDRNRPAATFPPMFSAVSATLRKSVRTFMGAFFSIFLFSTDSDEPCSSIRRHAYRSRAKTAKTTTTTSVTIGVEPSVPIPDLNRRCLTMLPPLPRYAR